MATTLTTTNRKRRTSLLRHFSEAAIPGERLASLDAVRGFTILVMIFVNDVAGVQGAPAWMKHMQPANADGMTFVDLVFPAFLFIVGMSIPFALERRLERGEARRNLWLHVLLRTLSLLIIGVLMVNTEHLSDAGMLHRSLWTFLMYVGVVLVWLTPPARLSISHSSLTALRIGGVALLLILALLYRGPGEPGLIELRPYWWGILGIIGWSYLAACGAYLLFRKDATALIGSMALLYCVYVAGASNYFSGFITEWVNVGSIGAHGGLTVSGVVLGVMLLPGSRLKTHGDRVKWALAYGLGLAAAGHLLHSAADVHRIFIINKVYATLPWCLWSAAITIWIWVAIYWLLDVLKNRRLTMILEHSGQNALLAYILAPILYAAFAYSFFLMGTTNLYAALGGEFVTGLARSVIFAFAVVWAAAILRRRSYLLKL